MPAVPGSSPLTRRSSTLVKGQDERPPDAPDRPRRHRFTQTLSAVFTFLLLTPVLSKTRHQQAWTMGSLIRAGGGSWTSVERTGLLLNPQKRRRQHKTRTRGGIWRLPRLACQSHNCGIGTIAGGSAQYALLAMRGLPLRHRGRTRTSEPNAAKPVWLYQFCEGLIARRPTAGSVTFRAACMEFPEFVVELFTPCSH
jgi:hypothetical protein